METTIHYVKRIRIGKIKILHIDDGRTVFTRKFSFESADLDNKEILVVVLFADAKAELKTFTTKELLIG